VFAYCVFLRHLCPRRKAASRKAAAGQLSQPGRQAAAAVAAVAAAQAPKGLPLSWLDIFVLSAVAKIGATLVTYPLLVVKNRLQVSNC
jgi:adenine nucleotide transporter 17